MANSIEQILTGLKTALAADKKKTAVLGVLCVVLLVVVVRQVLSGSSSEPSGAEASALIAHPPETSPSRHLIRPVVEETPLADHDRVLADSASGGSHRVVGGISSAHGKSVSVDGLPRTLSRNIFDTPAWHKFSPVVSRSVFESGGKANPSGSSLFGSVFEKLVEYQRSRHEEERRIEEDVARLKLESTMTGHVPLAHISGRLVREGEEVEGFSVVRIMDRRVVLRKSGITRVLSMP